jgi:hypothetical protein
VDHYVEFVAARCRPNTEAAARSDLGVFFSMIDKPSGEITPTDVCWSSSPSSGGDVVTGGWCALPTGRPACRPLLRSWLENDRTEEMVRFKQLIERDDDAPASEQ